MSISSSEIVRLWNCRQLCNGTLKSRDLWIRDGFLVDSNSAFFKERLAPSWQLDCGGLIVAPGFLELQINGGYGVDFSALNEDQEHSGGTLASGIERVGRQLIRHGVTAFCPTIISSDPQVYKQLLPQVWKISKHDFVPLIGNYFKVYLCK